MYQKVTEAWVDNGDVHVKTEKGPNMGGINTILRPSDIEKAAKENHHRNIPKTESQLKIFSRLIINKYIDISSFGKSEADIKTVAREERKRRNIMAKTKKVEWKLKGNTKSLDQVQEEMSGLIPEIRGIEKVGKSGFKGWVQLKEGKDDEADEITLVGSFSKGLSESDDFPITCNQITQILLKGQEGLKLKEFEVKE